MRAPAARAYRPVIHAATTRSHVAQIPQARPGVSAAQRLRCGSLQQTPPKHSPANCARMRAHAADAGAPDAAPPSACSSNFVRRRGREGPRRAASSAASAPSAAAASKAPLSPSPLKQLLSSSRAPIRSSQLGSASLQAWCRAISSHSTTKMLTHSGRKAPAPHPVASRSRCSAACIRPSSSSSLPGSSGASHGSLDMVRLINLGSTGRTEARSEMMQARGLRWALAGCLAPPAHAAAVRLESGPLQSLPICLHRLLTLQTTQTMQATLALRPSPHPALPCRCAPLSNCTSLLGLASPHLDTRWLRCAGWAG